MKISSLALMFLTGFWLTSFTYADDEVDLLADSDAGTSQETTIASGQRVADALNKAKDNNEYIMPAPTAANMSASNESVQNKSTRNEQNEARHLRESDKNDMAHPDTATGDDDY